MQNIKQTRADWSVEIKYRKYHHAALVRYLIKSNTLIQTK